MYYYWASITWFQGVFFPSKDLWIIFICWEIKVVKNIFICRQMVILRVAFFQVFMICSVNKVKSNGSLEIKLNCSTLMRSLQSVEQFNVNFRSIKSTIFRVFFPRFTKSIQSLFQLVFCLLPNVIISKVIIWFCR